jgi:hypothetical protein
MKDTYLQRLGNSESSCVSCDGTGAFDLFDGIACRSCNGLGITASYRPAKYSTTECRISTILSLTFFVSSVNPGEKSRGRDETN